MKKTLLMMFALVATSLAGFAQTNLALNKQAYASSVSDENATLTADKAVDGNTGTKWASNYDTKGTLGWDDAAKAAQWFYVDLGSEQTVNTVKISWDNQAAHKFDIRYSTTAPEEGQVKTTGTVALSGLSGTDNNQNTYKFNADVTARYIIIDLQERGAWGYGITELEVYNIDYNAAKLTAITVAPPFVKVGEATTLTLAGIDNFNNAIDATYSVGGATLENPYTATAAGSVTITGTDANGNAATASIYALDDTKAPTAPATGDVFQAIYTNDQAAKWAYEYNGGAKPYDDIELGSAKVKPFGTANCLYFTNNTLWSDIYNVNINPTAKQYGKLRLDVFSPVAAEGKVILEGTKKIGTDHAFTLTAGEWKTVEIDLDGETFIKAMSVRMDNGEDILLSNIYFTKADENEDAGKISTLAVFPQIVAAEVETALTLTASDAKGVEIDNANVAYSGTGYVDGKLTASAGAVVITGTTNEGAESATATVYALAAPTRTNGTDDIEILQSGKSATGQGTDWEGGYKAMGNLVYSDNTVAYHASDVTTLYLTNPGLSAADLTGVTKLHLDVFSPVADNVTVILENINAQATVAVAAGEWTSVDVPFTGGSAATSWIKVKFENKPEVVIDNVYFSKEAVVTPFNCEVDGGVATVTGDVMAEDIAEIEAADAMYIDLSGVTSLGAGVTTITPKNVNALIRVPGTVESNLATIDPSVQALKDNGTKNLVVTATWTFPVEQLRFRNNNGDAFWNGEGIGEGVKFISSGSRGYKITRSIAAGKYVTAYTTATVTADEGLTVYELGEYDTATKELKFNKKANRELVAGYPYILHNSTEDAIELVVEGTGDLNLNNTPGNSESNGITFVGNLKELKTNGTQYILFGDAGTLAIKEANGAVINPFRAYFTGLTSSSSVRALVFEGGLNTGIATIANGEIVAGQAYDLQGRRVQQLQRGGVYVIGGKKVMVK